MSKIYKRNCDVCGSYYKGYGAYFCSIRCKAIWRSAHPETPLTKRFWSKAEVTDLFKCWNWTSTKNHTGYGQFSIGRKGKKLAHRLAWQLTCGSIPQGKCVLHRCDNPKCVNPAHLFLGSQQDNIDDMVSKGRHGDARGVNNGRSKLTEQDVLTVRSLSEQGINQLVIAAKFNVHRSAIYKIASRKTWKHI
jgi:hypothetical protein